MWLVLVILTGMESVQQTLEDSQIGQDRTSQRGTRGGKKEEHWAEKRPAERLAP